LKKQKGAQYVAVPERKKEEIVREKYVQRTQAGMQEGINQRWLDRDRDRLINDICSGKVEAPPGFIEKHGLNNQVNDEY